MVSTVSTRKQATSNRQGPRAGGTSWAVGLLIQSSGNGRLAATATVRAVVAAEVRVNHLSSHSRRSPNSQHTGDGATEDRSLSRYILLVVSKNPAAIIE
jgi:hypothetical protein